MEMKPSGNQKSDICPFCKKRRKAVRQEMCNICKKNKRGKRK